MGFLEEFLLAVGLAMDAFSVSIYKGVKEGKLNLWLCATLGITFGLMQGIMPLIGYFLTSIPFLKTFIQNWSAYIIFLLLLYIGGKMLLDAIKENIEIKKLNQNKQENIKQENLQENYDQTNMQEQNTIESSTKTKKGLCFSKEILILGIATSIDALSIGITFTGQNMNLPAVMVAVSIIAIVSFVFSFLGCMFGKVLSKYIKNYAGIFGGIILIGIGIKVLIEHFI